MPFIGKQTTSNSQITNYTTTVGSGGQTNFTVVIEGGDETHVYLNGVLLKETTDYTVTSTQVSLVSPAVENDIVEIKVFRSFALVDAVRASDGGTFSGDVTVPNLTLSSNVIKASDGGSTITLDTSDNVTIAGNLKVKDGGTIGSASDADAITISSSGAVTLSSDFVPATPMSHRNMIINGGMNVSQRYATSSASLSGSNTGDYTVDRFALIVGSSYNLDTTSTQVSGDPNETGQSKALKIECDTVQSPSSIQNGGVFTKLEGQDLQRLLYGTASAKNSVLTFWAKAGGSGAGQYTCQIKYLKSGPTYYVQYHTFTLTTSWQKFTINLNANGTATSQPIINDNTAGMEIYWWLVAGSDDLVSASSTWTTGDNTYKAVTGQTHFMADTSNEFYLTGVQLELGSVATPFEHRSYGDELHRCQRYFQKIQNTTSGIEYFCTLQAYSSTACFGVIKDFITPMRAEPHTVTSSGTFGGYQAGSSNAGSGSLGGLIASPISWLTTGHTGLTGLSAGNAVTTYWNPNAYLTADAEL